MTSLEGSGLAGDGSHSTDQRSGRGKGHGTGRAGSAGALHEQKLQSKAEYSNTKQGLPGDGIYSHITRLMNSGNGHGINFQRKSN
jgi:hypothetical protein